MYKYRGMKRSLLIVSVIILITIILELSICLAAIYFSPFGFSVNISSRWEVINLKKIMEDPENDKFFDQYSKHFSIISEKQRKEMMHFFRTGQVEVWYYQDGSSNVTCWKEKGKGVIKRSQFEEYIKGLKKLLGSDAEVYDIGLKKIAGLDTFYIEYGGVVYGGKHLKLNIQITPGEYLKFTLTAQDDRFEALKKEFWRIISTFKPL